MVPSRSRSAAQLAVLVLALVLAGLILLVARNTWWSESSEHALGPGTSTTAPTSSTSTTTTTLDPMVAPPPTVVTPLPVGPMAPVVERVATTDRVLFITIDDGVVANAEALEYLTSRGIPFTNFLNLAPAQANEDFWKEVEAAGDPIEAHTISHPDLHTLGAAAQREQICGLNQPFTEMFGRQPTLFRPPYGNYSNSVRTIAAECGFKAVVMWKAVAAEGRLTLQDEALQPGDIILFHWRNTLLEDLQTVMARAQAEGFRFALLEDYLSPTG